jgi:DNA-directed RNA polymerase subunit RPC12/RpoP
MIDKSRYNKLKQIAFELRQELYGFRELYDADDPSSGKAIEDYDKFSDQDNAKIKTTKTTLKSKYRHRCKGCKTIWSDRDGRDGIVCPYCKQKTTIRISK